MLQKDLSTTKLGHLFSVNLCRITSRTSLNFHPSGPSKPNSFRHFAFLGRFLTELENACSSQVPKSHRCCDDPAEDYGVKDRLNGNEPMTPDTAVPPTPTSTWLAESPDAKSVSKMDVV